MKYKITYLNIKTGKREIYLNNASFETKSIVLKEIIRLENEQNHYEEINFGRTRKNFKHERISYDKHNARTVLYVSLNHDNLISFSNIADKKGISIDHFLDEAIQEKIEKEEN